MTDANEKLAALLGFVTETCEEEINCAECLELVAAYVEQLGTTGQAQGRMLKIEQHFKVCPECREEFDALLNVYMAELGL